MNAVWVIGQVTVDLIFRGRDSPTALRKPNHKPNPRIGGKAFNIAAAIARLEMPVCLISAVGDDRNGKSALHNMKAAAIDTAYVVEGHGGRTTPIHTPITRLTEGIYGERSVSVDLDKRLDEAYEISLTRALEGLDSEEHRPSAIIYTLEFSDVLLRSLATLVRKARALPKIRVLGNPAPRRPGIIPSRQIGELLRLSHVVTPNRYESQYLLGEEYEDDKLALVSRRIKEMYGVDCCICTAGNRGWSWSNGKSDGASHIQAVKVKEKVGASDVFTGAFLVLALGGAPTDVACLGAGVAAAVAVGKVGGHKRFPSRRELIIALQESAHPLAQAAINSLTNGRT